MDRFEQFWKWLERRAPWLAEDAARAGKVARGLPRSSKWLVFVALVALVLAWAWWPSCEGDGSVKDVLACSQVNRNYGLMVAGLFALVALYLNWQRTANDRRRTVNDTYVKAVEQLGHDKMEVRLGAIYALERIAATDRDYHWPIMETLCAYIRERPASEWGEEPASEAVESGEPAPAEPPLGSSSAEEEVERKGDKTEPKRPPTDIQAILTVFERRAEERKAWEEAQGLRLDLRHADLAGTVLSQVRLQRADLRGADLRLANLLDANLTLANLMGADLMGADLTEADLMRANLREADLRGADLRGANLTLADLRGANLRGADLTGANLREADLMRANLREADLRGADLRGANLTLADLRGADLREADLRGANLTLADLTGANLREADLRGANLTDADLMRADLRGARFSEHPSKLGADWNEAYPPRNLDKIITGGK